MWWRDACLQLLRRLGGRAPKDRRKFEQCRSPLPLEPRYARSGLGYQRLRAGNVINGVPPRFITLDGDLGLMGHDVERMVRNRKLFSERTNCRVGARGFRDHHHSHAIAHRSHRIRIGVRDFDRAVHPTEEIDLVRGLKDVFEQPKGLRRPAGQLQDLIRHGIASVEAAGRCLGRWVALGVRHRKHCPRSGEVCIGCSERAIRLQRLLNQRIELRVIVKAPPRIRRRRWCLDRRIQRHQRRLGSRRQRGRMIVRTYPARGERGGHDRSHDNGAERSNRDDA